MSGLKRWPPGRKPIERSSRTCAPSARLGRAVSRRRPAGGTGGAGVSRISTRRRRGCATTLPGTRAAVRAAEIRGVDRDDAALRRAATWRWPGTLAPGPRPRSPRCTRRSEPRRPRPSRTPASGEDRRAQCDGRTCLTPPPSVVVSGSSGSARAPSGTAASGSGSCAAARPGSRPSAATCPAARSRSRARAAAASPAPCAPSPTRCAA